MNDTAACEMPRRRSFWERHGSWVLLAVTSIGFTGLGLQIGAQMSINSLTTMALQHAQDMRELQEAHRVEVATLTAKVAEAAANAATASKAAAASASTATELARQRAEGSPQ